MTIEEREELLTQRVKLKLDSINYQITAISSYFVKDCLLRDGTYKDAIITGFYEPMLDSKSSVISDPETLEMLYVWTGPMNFVDIDDFFKP
jgi:hypothetical protein